MALYRCGIKKLKETTQSFGSHMYINHVGVPEQASGPSNWDITMTYEGQLTSFSLGNSYNGNTISSNQRYRLYARKNISDSWTLVADNRSTGTTTISNKNKYKYLRLQAYNGPSFAIWEEPAGNYWYLVAANFNVSYKYRG